MTTSTNLTDRLGELVKWLNDASHPEDVAAARFHFKRFFFTHKDEILSALRKAEEADTAIERLTADRDLWKQSEETCSRQHDLRAAEVERLTAREAELCEALRPFAAKDFETPVSDESGWTETGISWCRERIVDWFGPSDFFRARLSLGDEK